MMGGFSTADVAIVFIAWLAGLTMGAFLPRPLRAKLKSDQILPVLTVGALGILCVCAILLIVQRSASQQQAECQATFQQAFARSQQAAREGAEGVSRAQDRIFRADTPRERRAAMRAYNTARAEQDLGRSERPVPTYSCAVPGR